MTAQTQAQIAALAAQLADSDDDMTEATAGGGDFRKRFEPGWCVARLTSVIETGKHIELYQGKAKDPALMFRLGFELFSPGYTNDDGTPYFMETSEKSRSRNEKAWAFRTFKAMNYLGTAKNFFGLIGQIYLVEIKDYAPKAKPTEIRSVIGEIRAGIEPVSKQYYACPEATKLFAFSWAAPTLEGWDELFIEGTREDGSSKNWMQERIAGAVDFPGSALEGLLIANGRPIPKGTPQKTGAAPAGAQPAGATPAAPATPAPAVAAPATVAAPAAVAAPAVQAAPVVQAPAAVVAAPLAQAVAAPVVAAPVVAAPVVG